MLARRKERRDKGRKLILKLSLILTVSWMRGHGVQNGNKAIRLILIQ